MMRKILDWSFFLLIAVLMIATALLVRGLI